ncbi:hypothetical protein N2152v2_007264 [Parachlorella kessleri]
MAEAGRSRKHSTGDFHAAAHRSPQLLAAASQREQPQIKLPLDRVTGWSWQGQDAFSPLGDRRDAPPLPLPQLDSAKRVVLVRHGQSTWNARNRIQGSSDFAVLTDQGLKQAAAAGRLLQGLQFEVLFQSPLVRAVETADAVWRGRDGPRVVVPQLREVDLYSFQGLEKVEAKFQRSDEYRRWQNDPENFELDGHAPIRELWYRASLAWQAVLRSEHLGRQGLVVGHNAVNQALICTALGLSPAHFRRFTQTNAGFTVLDFQPGQQGSPPRVTVERLNQLSEIPLLPEKSGRPAINRLILVCRPSGGRRVRAALDLLAEYGVRAAPLMAIGSPEASSVVCTHGTQAQALDIKTALEASLGTPGRVRAVVAVADAAAIQVVLQMCLVGSQPGAMPAGSTEQQQQSQGGSMGSRFQIDEGSVTILNFAAEGATALSQGVLLCSNFAATVQE